MITVNNLRLIDLLLIIIFIFYQNCSIKEKCYYNEDCKSPKICNEKGICVYKCEQDIDCGEGFICKNHECIIKKNESPTTCPDDMVSIEGVFCIDKYEASRPDATETSEGVDSSMATSRYLVLPWLTNVNKEAELACNAAGKRLCTPQEWEYVCHGPDNTVYAYGNKYDPTICNGIDTFGKGNHHLAPTGSFPQCTNEWGVFDLNGNVWEHTQGGDTTTVRGGAYNCIDSETLHRCDYIPQTWTPSALGFRCCKGTNE